MTERDPPYDDDPPRIWGGTSAGGWEEAERLLWGALAALRVVAIEGHRFGRVLVQDGEGGTLTLFDNDNQELQSVQVETGPGGQIRARDDSGPLDVSPPEGREP